MAEFTTPPIPEGARLLETEEAVTMIVTGDHAQADLGDLEFAGAMITALRIGLVIAVRQADDRLAFAPGPNHPRYH